MAEIETWIASPIFKKGLWKVSLNPHRCWIIFEDWGGFLTLNCIEFCTFEISRRFAFLLL